MLNLYPNYIFWNKVLNQITARKNILWRFLPLQSISVKGLGKIPTKVELSVRLQEMFGSFQGIMQASPKDEQQVILDLAEETLDHKFDVLGSGPVEMQRIDWHIDFKSGNSWHKGVYYKNQRKLSATGSDIKVPWELSRCHHLLWLGEAYLLTKEDRYAKEIVDEIEDWISDNPLMYSVNWTCTMDVALRAVNWLYSIAMVLPSNVVNESFIIRFYKSLYQHGWFIYNNFEKTVPYSNNHLFSDYAGLLYLAELFNNTKRGSKWKRFVVPEFFEEIRRQILPSGVHYERSVSYHRLMTELASYPCFMLKRVGCSIPVDIEYRVRSMYSFVAAYTKNNGFAPLVEDNDDGRFLPFMRRDFRRHDYLLDLSSLELRIIANGIEPFKYEEIESRMYKDAGHAILRKGQAYLLVTNGGFSKYDNTAKEQGTHTHNDRLSFEFALGRDDIFIDPGAYVYTPNPEKCNEFRSTAKHNTVVVDGEEQNIFSRENVFLLKKNSRTTLFESRSNEDCEGEYITLKGAMRHNRQFFINDNCLLINDNLSKMGNSHQIVLSFHLPPDVSVVEDNEDVVIESASYTTIMSFKIEGAQPQLTIEEDTYSPSYGILQCSKTIRLRFSFDDSTNIQTKIRWQKKH